MAQQVPTFGSRQSSIGETGQDGRFSEIKGIAVGGIVKRAFDIAFAVLAIIALLPVLLFLCLLVKLEDGGPIFYRHRRIGRNDTPFHCLKFRTMVENGDQVLSEYLSRNAEARGEWNASRKLREDPRITATGRILRQTSLDELPQLLNIIRGEMSIVGPRPIVPDEIQFYGGDFVYYQSVRPGLTGAWQVSGRSDTSYDERVQLDRLYVEEWSFAKDILIIVKTIPAVAFARGSY